MDNTADKEIVKVNNFTIIPNDNTELYKKNSAFNILHVYIVERVRSFEKQGKTCYVKNEQLAAAIGSSEKTISRAIALLVQEKVLWAGYHYKTENDRVKKQRVLRVFSKELEEYHNKKLEKEIDKLSMSNNNEKEPNLNQGQNVQESWSNCLSQIDDMSALDSQNDSLEYKENIKENNYNKGEELDSSLLDSHNTHPEAHYEPFNGLYSKLSCNKRRSLEEIENAVVTKDMAC